MSTIPASNDHIHILRKRFLEARTVLNAAKLAYRTATQDLKRFLELNPPKTFRLQEAYQNPDGTYSVPHWDEVANYSDHNLVAQDEVDDHILNEGTWTEVFYNPDDDPRPGFRRVIEVTW